jgi:PAS domain-containing protein
VLLQIKPMNSHTYTDTRKTSEHIHGRVGSALLRLASLKERVSEGVGGSPRALSKLVDDVSKLTQELEQGFLDLQEAMARCATAQHFAAVSGQRADLLIEVAPFACLLVDSGGTIVEANPAAGAALNVSHGRLPGKPFLLFLNGDRELFLSRLSELIKRERPNRWSITLRPRERSLTQTMVVAAPQGDGHAMILLLPAQEEAHAAADDSSKQRTAVS